MHNVYPYLLRHLEVVKPNQVWALDITYIPMAKGFVYLTCVMDIYSTITLSRGIPKTLDASFCVLAYTQGVRMYESSDIIHTDQGPQFTSDAVVAAVGKFGARLSMDGKGT